MEEEEANVSLVPSGPGRVGSRNARMVAYYQHQSYRLVG